MQTVFLVAFGVISTIASTVYLDHLSQKMSPVAVPISKGDPSSYSNADVFVQKHLELKWKVDFDSKTISGIAELTIEPNPARPCPCDPDCARLILDTRDLNVSAVKLKEGGQELSFTLATPHAAFGAALVIDLPRSVKDAAFVLVIEYSTTPACSALQWLEPRQTAGKKHPFLFSQCQAIHARSLVPCQDTPAVKFTYNATVSAPGDLVVLMSAVKNEVGKNEGEATVDSSFFVKLKMDALQSP